jgi:cyclase
MLRTRLIPVLLLKNGILVRSRNFSFHQSTGNHIYQVERFSEWKADEIIYLDISRDSNHCMRLGNSIIGSTSSVLHNSEEYKYSTNITSVINKISKVCRVPLTVGGGIKSLEDIQSRLVEGADKISINTMAINNPDFISKASEKFGSQCIVVSIDVKKDGNSWKVYKNFGKVCTNLNVDEWAAKVEKLGAGEILIQSIDRDGNGSGYDLDLIRCIEEEVKIPIIALGGVGSFDHLVDGHRVSDNIALAAANIFHFTEQSVLNAKKHLSDNNVNVRI